MQIFKKLLFLLPLDKRKIPFLLIALIFITAILDTIGVASILPFIAIISNPQLIETNFFLNNMFEYSSIFGVESRQEFLIFLGILVLVLLLSSLTLKALRTLVQAQFTENSHYNMSRRLIEIYLHQPYSWFLNRNSTDFGRTILSEIGMIVGQCLTPLLNLLTQGILVILIIILLIIVDPKIALIASFSLSVAYFLIYKSIRSFLTKIGYERLKANENRFKFVSIAFGAIKELKLSGLEKKYVEQFSIASQDYARHQISSSVISQLPRFILEGIAFGGLLLMTMYLMINKGDFLNAVPIIALYAFAGYRMIPALQQVYAAIAYLSFINPVLDSVYRDINSLKIISEEQNQKELFFKENISLKNVYYSYPNSSKKSLKDISLSISKGSSVGIVGVTGSGKTTTINILLGLLDAQKGSLQIDGNVINKKNVKNWQRCIGYVPQNIYLIDDTVAANIAFCGEKNLISQLDVEKASKIANLHNFVMNELPLKYQTVIGEQGVRLSGGQRQRIGIARALYHNPQLLIFDEATSALDSQTEADVMKEIFNLDKKITTILISHRMDIIKNCDNIFLFENGSIIKQGKFENIVDKN